MKLRELSQEQWRDSLIIFDTSALCKVYDMTDPAKKTMMEILEYLKNQIFIPGHVWEEYLKNREKVIRNPLKERYTVPKVFDNTELKTEGRRYLKLFEEYKEYHPFISEESFNKVNKALEDTLKNLSEIKETLGEEVKQRRKEIEDLVHHDIVLEKLATLRHGDDYDFVTMLQLAKEGEFRYDHQIPPGYMDASSKNGNPKTSVDKFGDLFVWKQILEDAKTERKGVIFICNDGKEDWWDDYKKMLLRHELIKEFKDETQYSITAVNLEGFIDELKARFKNDETIPFYEGLEAVKDVLEYYSHFSAYGLSEDDVYAILKCSTCGHKNRILLSDIDFVWDEDSWSEGEMGPEYGYSCQHLKECDECGEEIELQFTLIEYPAGQIEYIEAECENAEIVNDPNWRRAVSATFSRPVEICLNCGRHVHYLKNDWCDECYDELQYRLQKD